MEKIFTLKKIEKYMKYTIVRIIINSLLKAMNSLDNIIKRKNYKKRTRLLSKIPNYNVDSLLEEI